MGRKRSIQLMAMPVLLVLIALAAILVYQSTATRDFEQLSYNSLRNIAQEQAGQLSDKFEAQGGFLRAFASSAALDEDLDRDGLITRMKTLTEPTEFAELGFLNADGVGFLSSGVDFSAQGMEYFTRAFAGEQVVLTARDVSNGRNRFVFAVPVTGPLGRRGVVVGNVEEQCFRELLSESSISDGGYSFVCDGEGNVVIGCDSAQYLGGNNILDVFSEYGLDEGYTLAGLFGDLSAGAEGHVGYTLLGSRRHAVYTPLGLNDWMLFHVLPVGQQSAQEALIDRGNLMIVLMMSVSLLALAGIYGLNQRSVRRIEADREQLRLSETRFRLALENTSVCIWDYDLASHTIIQSDSGSMLYGAQKVVFNVPQSLVGDGMVHPDDVQEFLAFYAGADAGEEYVAGVFRLRRGESGYRYYDMRYRTMRDERGRPYRAIGIAEDVTERFVAAEQYQSELRQLSDLAQRDPLTGLLNRGAAEAAVAGHLSKCKPGELSALYIIDLDGFKRVNDRLGHQSGDETLTVIAEAISGIFRSSDVVGRLGGDEFVVFLPAAPSRALIETRAGELCTALQYVYPVDGGEIQVSASIGVALCSGSEHTFAELYRVADGALYDAKRAGRACFVLRRLDEAGAEEETIPLSAPEVGAAGVPLQTLLEYLDGGVVLCEMGEMPRVLYASPAFYARNAQGRADAPDAATLFSGVHPDDRAMLFAAMREGAEQGTAIEQTYRVTEPDGSSGWRRLRAVCIPYRGAEAPVLLGVLSDITDLVRGREELRESNERLRFALERSGMLPWQLDLRTGELRFWEIGRPNANAARLREWLIAREEDDALRTFFAEQRTRVKGESCFTVPDGAQTVRCHLRCHTVCDEEGKPIRIFGVVEEHAEEAL